MKAINEVHGPSPAVIAAIELGATSARLEIAQTAAKADFERIESLVRPIDIGRDTYRIGIITPQTLRVIEQVMHRFSQVIAEYGVARVAACGTSALAEARNRDVVADRVLHESGISLKFLEPPEHARLTFQAAARFCARNSIDSSEGLLILDIGGGTTDLMQIRDGRLTGTATCKMGVARLQCSLETPKCEDRAQLMESIVRTAVRSTREMMRDLKARTCLVVNPAIAAAVTAYSTEARRLTGGLEFSGEAFGGMIAGLSSYRPEDFCERSGVVLAEAELVVPAAFVMETFRETIGFDRVFFMDSDSLTGLMMDAEKELRGEDPSMCFAAETLGAATGLAERCRADIKHSSHVRRLSSMLFQDLHGFFDLTERDGVLLEVAAILHDIGRFISDRDHHKHSRYIINSSAIIGLSEDEKQIVALIARYHRKGRPKIEHLEFGSLAPFDRMRVSKLSALLRVGDALDRDHDHLVSSVRVHLGSTAMELAVESSGDLAIEAEAVRRKGNLLEDLAGMTVNVRRRLA